MVEFSLVLPCYNESRSLPSLVSRVMRSVQKRNLSSDSFSLILVENGSKDDSLRVMEELKAGEHGKFLQIVRVEKNQGYGYGLYQGLKSSKSENVGWSHADEQCDPEDAFLAWEMLKEKGPGYLIKGKRFGRAFLDRVVSKVFEVVILLVMFKKIQEVNAQPKVFQKKLLSVIINPPNDFAFDLYVLLKAKEIGLKFCEIEVQFPPRIHGESNWSSSFRSKVRTISKMLSYILRYRFKSG